MKNRDFEYKGIKFHLNDNGSRFSPRREYEGKYWLLWWNEAYERWQSLLTVDSKREAEFMVEMRISNNHYEVGLYYEQCDGTYGYPMNHNVYGIGDKKNANGCYNRYKRKAKAWSREV